MPADTVDSREEGLVPVPPYTLYDTRSLSPLADHVKITREFPGIAAKPEGVSGGGLYAVPLTENVLTYPSQLACPSPPEYARA